MRHLDAGMSRLDARWPARARDRYTVVSITASLVAVFIPILFASGMIGAFFREFTVTLVAAICVSAVVSLTLTPALCSRFCPRTPSQNDRAASAPGWSGCMPACCACTVALDFSLRHALLLALTRCC
ncbi:efflux RND transporter permease subunit [Xanthomonas translucens pv. translucens]|nr:efflux RND transporter permease subunit [Xanthomonas translucens pv. translucens]